MNRFLSVTRIALVLAMLGVLGFAKPLYAGEYDLVVTGHYKITATEGNLNKGLIQGKSEPGGHLTGDFEFTISEDGSHIEGIICYDYQDGMWAALYVVDYVPELDAYVGTVEILFGKGIFEGATGGGLGYVEAGKKGKFGVLGTISLPD